MSPTKASPQERLIRAIERLEKTIGNQPEEHEIAFHPLRTLIFGLLRGIMYGLGIIIAFAIVLPFLILLLRQVQWVPIVGDFLLDVSQRIQESSVPMMPQ